MGPCRENELTEKIKMLEKELDYYKNYDALTNIYSKQSFYEHVGDILKQASPSQYELICADIEHFKLINDVYGTDLGDILLNRISIKLQEAFGKEACYGRIGADIFAICLPRVQGGDKAAETINEIFHSFSKDMEVIPSIGIYDIKVLDIPVSLMCDRAILAAKSVKGIYMKYYAYYDNSMRNVLLEEQELINGIDKSLENGEFEIYFQPKCNMNTNKITGAEVLVRWNHPQKGMISPKDFIPVFEKNGFIKKLDQFVWEESAKWLHKHAKEHKILPISVNISRIDIFGLDVQDIFQNLVKRYELDPSWMQLEITESAYSSRSDEIIFVINHLMNHGFTVLMDDFGSGYSSLNILKDINIDVLKMDMRFLDKQDRKSQDIIESVIRMAKWLNLKIIAEGVESKEQVDFLLKIGCLYAQGFYYYKPMPMDAFEKLLENRDLVDFEDDKMMLANDISLIKLKDLFHDDIVSEILLNNILGAVAIYRFDGNNVYVQKANEAYYKLHKFSMHNKNILEVMHPDDQQLFMDALKHSLNQRDSGTDTTVRYLYNEQILWLHVRLFFLSDTANGKILYASINDVSAYMNTLEELQMCEQSFRIAMDTDKITIFELDIASHMVTYSKQTQRAFGLHDCAMPAPEGFINHGTVCKGYEEIFAKTYEKIYKGEEHASCVIKARMADKNIVWNRITMTAIKNKSGKSIKAVGVVEQVDY